MSLINFRADPAAERALADLTADGSTTSGAIRRALEDRSAPDRIFRPVIAIGGKSTRVLVEQTVTTAPERLGRWVGHVSRAEMDDMDEALRLVLELD